MADKQVKVIITADDKASGVLGKAASGISNNLGKISIAGTAMGAALTAGVTSSISAFAEAEESQKKLENSIIGLSGGTMAQVKSIDTLSSSLQKKVGIDGDALKTGVAQLATFKLQATSVEALTKTVADLTVNQHGLGASSEQYEQSANIMYKALNGQFGILEKSGIVFTEAQQYTLQYGTEVERVAALQEGLAQNLKYTTDNAAGTAMQMSILRTSIGEISESIGAALAPAFSSLAQAIVPIVEKISSWATENPKLVTTILAVVAGISGLMIVLYPLVTAIGAVSTALKFLAANPVVLIIGLIIAAVILLITHWDLVKAVTLATWEAIKAGLLAAWNAISAAFTATWEAIKGAVVAVWEAIKGAFTAAWEAIKAGVMAALEVILLAFTFAFGGWLILVIQNWEAIKTAFVAAWEAIKAALGAAFTAISTSISEFMARAKVIFQTGWEGIKTVVVTVGTAIKTAVSEFVTGIIERFTEFFGKVTTGWGEFWQGLSSAATGMIAGITGAIGALFDKIVGVVNKLIELKEQAKAALGFGGGGSTGGRGGGGGGGRSATGGNRYAGESVLVGENGPERVIFGRGANIVPNNRLGGGGGGLTINVNVTGNTMLADDRAIAESIGDIITQQFRLSNKFG